MLSLVKRTARHGCTNSNWWRAAHRPRLYITSMEGSWTFEKFLPIIPTDCYYLEWSPVFSRVLNHFTTFWNTAHVLLYDILSNSERKRGFFLRRNFCLQLPTVVYINYNHVIFRGRYPFYCKTVLIISIPINTFSIYNYSTHMSIKWSHAFIIGVFPRVFMNFQPFWV